VVLRRANVGCGSIQPEGWDNYDSGQPWDVEGALYWDVNQRLSLGNFVVDYYDYAVCSFMLQELNHHEIPGALENMMAILKPGGTLRILVPNIVNAIYAYQHKEEGWFPQDDRSGDLDGKFCTYICWFGTVRSVFTREYLYALADPFGDVFGMPYGETFTGDSTITELDSRPKEALIVEVQKP
jgi:predicted SAM-dependent methyltransferase